MKRLSGITELNLLVNGERRAVAARPSDTLLRVLREELGLTGAKAGCENGDCGACTVLLDGLPVKSCLLLAVEAEGHRITTAEGLKDTPVQKAFLEFNGFQCGYCTAGFLLNAHSLIAAHPEPDEEPTGSGSSPTSAGAPATKASGRPCPPPGHWRRGRAARKGRTVPGRCSR